VRASADSLNHESEQLRHMVGGFLTTVRAV
jgi:hypothetical protein